MFSTQQRQQAWSTLSNAGNQARELSRETAAKIDEVRANGNWTERYKDEQVAKLREGLEANLAEIRSGADAARDLLGQVAAELDQPAGDSAAQLLAETRQQRAWERARTQLDAGRSHHDLIKAAGAAGDAATLAALRSELPAYLEGKHPRPSGLDGRGESAAVDVAHLNRALDVATARGLGDDKGAGTAARLRLHASTQHAVAAAQVKLGTVGRGNMAAALEATMAKRAAEQTQQELGEAPAGDAA